MGDGAYRLWQQWQQMHYPRRGLPADEATRAVLVTLDGTAGPILERYFCRGQAARTLNAEALGTLRHCRSELDLDELSTDAARYFGRLRQLIEFVLADAGRGVPGHLVSPPSPMTLEGRR